MTFTENHPGGEKNMKMNETHQPCNPKQEKALYRIGIFAAMNHVTMKTLRFYEEKGLLIPACIQEDNGYRYYTLDQSAVLLQINSLKSAGFTLDEIHALQNGGNQKDIISQRKAKILDEIARLTNQLAVLETCGSQDAKMLSSAVTVRNIEKVTVACMDEIITSYDCLFDAMPEMGELMEKANCICAVPDYCFTMYMEDGYQEENIPVRLCQAVEEEKQAIGKLQFETLEEIQAACIYHHGSYDTLHHTYASILSWIEKNGYQIDGQIRESYIDGVWNQEDENSWLTEIQIPVRKG